jgi:hypothetical protein
MPFPLRFPLAFDRELLAQVVRLFTDTVSRWYRKRHQALGLSDREPSALCRTSDRFTAERAEGPGSSPR